MMIVGILIFIACFSIFYIIIMKPLSKKIDEKLTQSEEEGDLNTERQIILKIKEYIKQKLLHADELISNQWTQVRDSEKKAEEKQILFNRKLETLEVLRQRINLEEERLGIEKEQWLKKQEEDNHRILEECHRFEAEKLKFEEVVRNFEQVRNHLEEQKDRVIQKEQELAEKEKQHKIEVTILKDELKKALEESRSLKQERDQLAEQLKLLKEKIKFDTPPKNEDDIIGQGFLGTQPVTYDEKNGDSVTPVPKREPIERGGGRFPTNNQIKKDEAKLNRFDSHKAEIICLKRSRQWIFAVEISEDLLNESQIQLYQDSSILQQVENEARIWYLEQTNQNVIVKWGEDSTEIKLGENSYLIFRLIGQNQNYGRIVKSPSLGSYLVIVPETWQRDEKLSGKAYVSPEPASFPGFQAHFFDLEKGDNAKIAFITEDNKQVVIRRKSQIFKLIGFNINDAEEKMGPLFGKEVPRIRARDKKNWEEVHTIIVGEEGLGRGKWRMEFQPDAEKGDQELPGELQTKVRGWYFIRFYDKNEELIESMDFRFVSSLYAININQCSPIPYNYEYKPALVEFIHKGELKIKPKDSHAQNLKVYYEDQKVAIMVQPNLNYDRTKWLLCDENGREVPVTILVLRIWWAISDEKTEPFNWSCDLLKAARNDFSASSDKALWIRFPCQRWVKSVLAGFDYSKTKQYPVKVTEQNIFIPFRDFCDSEELGSLGVAAFKIWFEYQGEEYTLTLINIHITWKCKHCDFLADGQDKFYRHFESSHIHEFFRPLTYKEMHRYVPTLPPTIYKCAHKDCSIYVKEDDLLNPTSAIYDHLIKCHPRKRHSFKVISDVEEIRKNVLLDLPIIEKCLLCDSDLIDASKIAKMEHLKEIHWKSLYEVQQGVEGNESN